MEWSNTVLPSQHVTSAIFCSEVGRTGLDGWSKPSSTRSYPLILHRSRVCLHAHNISRVRGGFSMLKVNPIFKINAAVDDSSSHLTVSGWYVGAIIQRLTKIGCTATPRSADAQRFSAQIWTPGWNRNVSIHGISWAHKESAEGEQTMKDHPGRKDGMLQWFRNAVARRTSQKEELTSSLRRYGVAGILSYGLLNTLYYLGAFLFVWFYVAPSPGGLGFVPAAKRFFRIFATVWAGSQVTKLFRVAGALSLAPFVDKGLNWFTQHFNFKSRGTAFSVLVGACFGLAALVFVVITTLWS